jgi:hypothetical protein
LSMEELDLIEFLVAQVAALSSSLAATTESSAPPLVVREVVISQSDPGVPCAHHRAVRDVSTTVVRSSTPPSMALELQAIGVGESFMAKLPDIAALETDRKGSTFICDCRSARLATKCHGGTFALPAPRRHLPNKVVPWRRLACPRPCSMRPLHGGTSFGRCCFASPVPPDRIGCHE